MNSFWKTCSVFQLLGLKQIPLGESFQGEFFLFCITKLPITLFNLSLTTRFSKDIDVVDDKLPRSVDAVVYFGFEVIIFGFWSVCQWRDFYYVLTNTAHSISPYIIKISDCKISNSYSLFLKDLDRSGLQVWMFSEHVNENWLKLQILLFIYYLHHRPLTAFSVYFSLMRFVTKDWLSAKRYLSAQSPFRKRLSSPDVLVWDESDWPSPF